MSWCEKPELASAEEEKRNPEHLNHQGHQAHQEVKLWIGVQTQTCFSWCPLSLGGWRGSSGVSSALSVVSGLLHLECRERR